jgi:hypothetical protein
VQVGCAQQDAVEELRDIAGEVGFDQAAAFDAHVLDDLVGSIAACLFQVPMRSASVPISESGTMVPVRAPACQASRSKGTSCVTAPSRAMTRCTETLEMGSRNQAIVPAA